MGTNSSIEWTDHTFNPWVGCVKVSPGCKHCYAEELMTRKGRWANTWGPAQTSERIKTSDNNWRKPLAWNKQAEKEGRRFKVFCASLADVFEDNDQLIDWRLDLFDLVKNTPCLDWQILTKRPEVARHFFRLRSDFLLPNVWIGTSVETQEYADKRIPELLKIPAAIRFLSVEPLLGAVSIRPWLPDNWVFKQAPGGHHFGIDWVIVGGESGPQARPMHPEWARVIRDQCQTAGVLFFFKQWGEWLPVSMPHQNHNGLRAIMDSKGVARCPATWADIVATRGDIYGFERVGKHAAGRLLDGREWNEIPEAQPVQAEGDIRLLDVRTKIG